jgi:hypothetical protein
MTTHRITIRLYETEIQRFEAYRTQSTFFAPAESEAARKLLLDGLNRWETHLGNPATKAAAAGYATHTKTRKPRK